MGLRPWVGLLVVALLVPSGTAILDRVEPLEESTDGGQLVEAGGGVPNIPLANAAPDQGADAAEDAFEPRPPVQQRPRETGPPWEGIIGYDQLLTRFTNEGFAPVQCSVVVVDEERTRARIPIVEMGSMLELHYNRAYRDGGGIVIVGEVQASRGLPRENMDLFGVVVHYNESSKRDPLAYPQKMDLPLDSARVPAIYYKSVEVPVTDFYEMRQLADHDATFTADSNNISADGSVPFKIRVAVPEESSHVRIEFSVAAFTGTHPEDIVVGACGTLILGRATSEWVVVTDDVKWFQAQLADSFRRESRVVLRG